MVLIGSVGMLLRCESDIAVPVAAVSVILTGMLISYSRLLRLTSSTASHYGDCPRLLASRAM
jgi:hypothetical protein